MQFSCTWLYEDTVRVSVLKDITMSYLTAFLLVVCSIVSSMFYDLCLRKKNSLECELKIQLSLLYHIIVTTP